VAVFHCHRFPHGEIPIRTRLGLVIFTDGQAEVSDPELAAALREVPASFEIKQVIDLYQEDARAPAITPRPAQSAKKQVWVDWVVAEGADQEAAERLSKDQLIELANNMVAVQPASEE
jgi:hypothetical protein